MEEGIEFLRNGYETTIKYPKKPGKLQRIDTYFITRAGVSWPSINSQGYYCIFGEKKEPTLGDKKPLVFLKEGEHHPMENYFKNLTFYTNRQNFNCERLFANIENNKGFEDSLLKYVREKKIYNIRLWDSSKFEDFQHGASLINQWKTDHALEIPADTLLGQQVRTMAPEDSNAKPEERFYAVMALIRVLGSFEHYPGRNNGGGFTGFANFKHRERSGNEGGGSYQEIFVR